MVRSKEHYATGTDVREKRASLFSSKLGLSIRSYRNSFIEIITMKGKHSGKSI